MPKTPTDWADQEAESLWNAIEACEHKRDELAAIRAALLRAAERPNEDTKLLEAFKDLLRLTEHICKQTGYSAKLDMHRAAIHAAMESKK